MNSTETDQIARFVRGTLGCQCPDDVFGSITVEPLDPALGPLPFTRLVIGDRLLIYLARPRSGDMQAAWIAGLARQGQAERDAAGYNRFRLVIPAAYGDEQADSARRTFTETVGQDERAHLHIVASDDLPGSIGR